MKKVNKTYVMDPEIALKLKGIAWLERKNISDKLSEILSSYFSHWDKNHRTKISHIIDDEAFKEYATKA